MMFFAWGMGLTGSIIRFHFCLCCSLWFKVSYSFSLLCADRSPSSRQLVWVFFTGAGESRREEEESSLRLKKPKSYWDHISCFFLSSATAMEDRFSWQIGLTLEDMVSFLMMPFLFVPLWPISDRMPDRRWLYFLHVFSDVSLVGMSSGLLPSDCASLLHSP